MLILTVWGVYLLLGLLFTIVFLIRGIHKIDAGAEGTGFGFKLLIAPGVMIFWPLLLRKIMSNSQS